MLGLDPYRFRLGDTSTAGTAIFLLNEYYAPFPSAPQNRPFLNTTAESHSVFYIPKTPGNKRHLLSTAIDAYSLGSAGIARFTGVDGWTFDGVHGSSVELSNLGLRRFLRTSLNSAQIVFDAGRTTVPTLASGELADLIPSTPPIEELSAGGGTSAFPLSIVDIGANTTRQPRSISAVTGVSGAIELVLGPAGEGTFPRDVSVINNLDGSSSTVLEGGWNWATILNFTDPIAAIDPTAAGLFTVDPAKLYIADVVLSSPEADSSVASDSFPELRVRMTMGGSQEAQAVFSLRGEGRTDGVGSRISTSPKVYSVAARSQGLSGTAGTKGHLFIDFFNAGLGASYNQSAANRSIIIHRVIVREYDLP
jgi:hypothetical protein